MAVMAVMINFLFVTFHQYINDRYTLSPPCSVSERSAMAP